VKEQRRQGSFELKLLQRQYPYYDEGAGASWQTFHQCVTDNGVGGTSESSDGRPLASARYSRHLPGTTGSRSGGCPGDDQIGEQFELRQDTENVVEPSDFKRFTQQFALTYSEQVLTYLLQATLKSAVYSTTGPHFGLALDSYTRCNSPLRRYPDLLIQRVCIRCLSRARSPHYPC